MKTTRCHLWNCGSATTTPLGACGAAIGADDLILLTDVASLYSADPRSDADARPITDVLHPSQIESLKKSPGMAAAGELVA